MDMAMVAGCRIARAVTLEWADFVVVRFYLPN
jgi:hypothetical protein